MYAIPRVIAAALVAAALTQFSAPAFAQVCVTPPSGAIAWYPADRHADDAAGFFNGTREGDTSFVVGKVGESFALDGAAPPGNDRVSTSALAEEMRAVRSFTYEMWARPTAALPVCAESNSANCEAAQLPWAIYPFHGEVNAPPGEIGMAAGIGIAIGTDGICVGEHGPSLVDCLARLNTPINNWTHIVAVVENKMPRIYVNGALAHTGIASAKAFVFASWSTLGSGLHLGSYAGDLDEVTIYDRVLADNEIAALFAAGTAGKCQPGCPTEQVDDPWQNAQVLLNSPLTSNNATGTFGGQSSTPEPTHTLFADGYPDGTEFSVEWQIAAPITLSGFGFAAWHDGAANLQRAFRRFQLQARPMGGGYTVVYDSAIVTPYAPGSRDLARCVNLRPSTAQQFRATFTQEGPPGYSGPRVVELDANPKVDRMFANGFE